MHSVRLLVAVMLVVLAAPVAGSVYVLGFTSVSEPYIGLAAAALVAVLLLGIGHGVFHRSRPDTPYW